MATTHSGMSFNQDWFYIRNVGNTDDRYRYHFTGTVNSIDVANKKANVTIRFYASAKWGGYGMFWSMYNDVFVQTGDTVYNTQTRYYVSTIGTGDSATATTNYVDKTVTHPTAGGSSGATTQSNGNFFTWTGDVNYTVSGANATCAITLYHAQSTSSGGQSYCPVGTSKTLRATWNLPSLYKITYNGNNGTPSTSETWVQSGNAVTLPTATKSNSAEYNGLAITTAYNANGGASTPSSQTSYRKYYTSYSLKGWYTAASGGTAAGAGGASYTPQAGITLYAQWNETANTTNNYTSITTAAAITRANSGNHLGGSNIVTSFNANGGTSTPSNINSQRYYQTKYTFNKWLIGSSSSTTSVNASATYTPQSSNTLYAGWATSEVAQSTYQSIQLPAAIAHNPTTSTSSYTITFSYGSGSGTTSTATAAATVSTNYTFEGWRAGSTNGTLYSAGASVSPTATSTYYASWTTSTVSGAYATITLPTATAPTNYAFDGWYTASSGGTLVGSAGSAYQPTATTTLYAHYINAAVAAPAAVGIYVKTTSGWKELNDFARVKTASTTWKTYQDTVE